MASDNACAELVSHYMSGLARDFETAPSNNGCFISTPFIRPDGEGIELELETLPNGQARLSDMGDTLGYLFVNGLTLTRTTLDKARQLSRPYGVSLDRTALNIAVDPEVAGDGLRGLIQAVLAVTQLIQLRRHPAGRVRFDDEVESFVIYSGVTYDLDYEIEGLHEKQRFKFHVNSGRDLLVQPITASTEGAAHTWAERWAYRFSDVRGGETDWRQVAVLDDRSDRKIWTPDAMAPIQEYAILWAEREQLTELLSPV